jgi:hypothetical protein
MTVMTTGRSDPERHRAQVRAANRARYRAIRMLIDENQRRFDELYAQQCRFEGVVPAGPHTTQRERRSKLEAEIAELRAQLAEMGGEAAAPGDIDEDGDGDGTAA